MRTFLLVVLFWTSLAVLVSSDILRDNVRHNSLRQSSHSIVPRRKDESSSLWRRVAREFPSLQRHLQQETANDETKSFLDIFPEGYNTNSGIHYNMFHSIFHDNGETEPTLSPAPVGVSTTATTTLAPTTNNDNGGSSSNTAVPTMGDTPAGDTDAPTVAPAASTAPPTLGGTVNNPGDPPTIAPTQGGTLNNNPDPPTVAPTQGGTLNNNPGDASTSAPTQDGTLNNNGEPPTAPPTQGGTLNNNGDPPTIAPTQDGTLKNNNGEPPTAPPTQGGTLNNNGGPPTAPPTQGGTLNNNGGPPTAPPTQGGTLNNNGEPPTAPPTQDSTLNVNDPPSDGGNTTDGTNGNIEPGPNTTTNTTDTNSTEAPIDEGNSTTLPTQEPNDGNVTIPSENPTDTSTLSPQEEEEAANGTETPNDTTGSTESPLDDATTSPTSTLAPTEINDEVGNNTTNLQGNDVNGTDTEDNNDVTEGNTTTSPGENATSTISPTTNTNNTDGNETDGNATDSLATSEPNGTTLAPTTSSEQVEGNMTLVEENSTTTDDSSTEGFNGTDVQESVLEKPTHPPPAGYTFTNIFSNTMLFIFKLLLLYSLLSYGLREPLNVVETDPTFKKSILQVTFAPWEFPNHIEVERQHQLPAHSLPKPPPHPPPRKIIWPLSRGWNTKDGGKMPTSSAIPLRPGGKARQADFAALTRFLPDTSISLFLWNQVDHHQPLRPFCSLSLKMPSNSVTTRPSSLTEHTRPVKKASSSVEDVASFPKPPPNMNRSTKSTTETTTPDATSALKQLTLGTGKRSTADKPDASPKRSPERLPSPSKKAKPAILKSTTASTKKPLKKKSSNQAKLSKVAKAAAEAASKGDWSNKDAGANRKMSKQQKGHYRTTIDPKTKPNTNTKKSDGSEVAKEGNTKDQEKGNDKHNKMTKTTNGSKPFETGTPTSTFAAVAAKLPATPLKKPNYGPSTKDDNPMTMLTKLPTKEKTDDKADERWTTPEASVRPPNSPKITVPEKERTTNSAPPTNTKSNLVTPGAPASMDVDPEETQVTTAAAVPQESTTTSKATTTPLKPSWNAKLWKVAQSSKTKTKGSIHMDPNEGRLFTHFILVAMDSTPTTVRKMKHDNTENLFYLFEVAKMVDPRAKLLPYDDRDPTKTNAATIIKNFHDKSKMPSDIEKLRKYLDGFRYATNASGTSATWFNMRLELSIPPGRFVKELHSNMQEELDPEDSAACKARIYSKSCQIPHSEKCGWALASCHLACAEDWTNWAQHQMNLVRTEGRSETLDYLDTRHITISAKVEVLKTKAQLQRFEKGKKGSGAANKKMDPADKCIHFECTSGCRDYVAEVLRAVVKEKSMVQKITMAPLRFFGTIAQARSEGEIQYISRAQNLQRRICHSLSFELSEDLRDLDTPSTMIQGLCLRDLIFLLNSKCGRPLFYHLERQNNGKVAFFYGNNTKKKSSDVVKHLLTYLLHHFDNNPALFQWFSDAAVLRSRTTEWDTKEDRPITAQERASKEDEATAVQEVAHLFKIEGMDLLQSTEDEEADELDRGAPGPAFEPDQNSLRTRQEYEMTIEVDDDSTIATQATSTSKATPPAASMNIEGTSHSYEAGLDAGVSAVSAHGAPASRG